MGPARHRETGSDHQIGRPVEQRAEDAVELGRIAASVGVHHHHDLGPSRDQAGMAGRAVAALGYGHDPCAMIASDLRRPVAGAVVGHDHPHPGRNAWQQPAQAVDLVEARAE